MILVKPRNPLEDEINDLRRNGYSDEIIQEILMQRNNGKPKSDLYSMPAQSLTAARGSDIPPAAMWTELSNVSRGRLQLSERKFSRLKGWHVFDWEITVALKSLQRTIQNLDSRQFRKGSHRDAAMSAALRQPMSYEEQVHTLGDALIIYGSNDAYGVGRAGEVMQDQFGDIGSRALKSIQTALMRKGIPVECPSGIARAVQASDDQFILYFGTQVSLNQRQAFAEAVEFACKAIRPNPNLQRNVTKLVPSWDRVLEQMKSDTFDPEKTVREWEVKNQIRDPYRSSATREKEISTTLDIRSSHLRDFSNLPIIEPRSVGNANCWLQCFHSAIIADHNIKREPGWEGIEVDFSLMCELAGITNLRHVKRGSELLVLPIGPTTALLPWKRAHDKIQWHLHVFEKGPDRNFFKTVENFPTKNLLSEKEIERLMLPLHKRPNDNPRSYLGWAANAHVKLGTMETPVNDLGYSGMPTIAKIQHESARTASISGSFRVAAIFSLGLSGSKSYAPVSTVQKFDPDKNNFAQIILYGIKQVALIYDQTSKRGWLVPKLSLLLHLAHKMYADNQGLSEHRTDPLPFAQSQSDGAYAVVQAIKHKSDTILFQLGDKESQQYTLENAFVDFNTSLAGSPAIGEAPSSRHYYACELAALFDKPGAGAPTVMVGKPDWGNLPQYCDVVVACSGLGPVLKKEGVPPSKSCGCESVGQQAQYLGATMRCLELLALRANSTIPWSYNEEVKPILIGKSPARNGDGRDAWWKPTAWRGCSHDGKYWQGNVEDIVQRIHSKAWIGKGTSTSRVTLTKDGAVVFAGGRLPDFVQKGWNGVRDKVTSRERENVEIHERSMDRSISRPNDTRDNSTALRPLRNNAYSADGQHQVEQLDMQPALRGQPFTQSSPQVQSFVQPSPQGRGFTGPVSQQYSSRRWLGILTRKKSV